MNVNEIQNNIKKHIQKANEEKDKNPHSVVVELVEALKASGLVDDEGNIINNPENSGSQRK